MAGKQSNAETTREATMPSRPPKMKMGSGAPSYRKTWATKSVAADRRIRGRRGQAIRADFLRRFPLCCQCDEEGHVTAAVIVDHRIPLAEDGEDTDDNRQSLCKRHHDLKSAKEAARGRVRGAG